MEIKRVAFTPLEMMTKANNDDGNISRKHFLSPTGFTLYELLLVIVVIGILSAILFPVMMRARIRSYETNASSDIGQLTTAIRMYAEDWGTYPPDDSALDYKCGILLRALEHEKDAHGRGEYIKYPSSKKDGASSDSNLLDSWKRPYYYRLSAAPEGKIPYRLWSEGAKPGTGNDSDDITNW